MDKITCTDCGTILGNQTDNCSVCRSEKKTVYMTIEDSLETKDEAEIAMIHHHMVWSYLPKSLHILITNLNRRPFNRAQTGFIIQAINSIASLIEGVLTDSIEARLTEMRKEQIDDELLNYPRKWKFATWTQKKEIVSRMFEIDIMTVSEHAAISVLFDLRNMLSHGRPYQVATKWTSTFEGTDIKETEILNAEYVLIYQKLISVDLSFGLNEDERTIGHRDIFMTVSVTKFLYSAAVSFLNDFTKRPAIDKLYNVSRAWEWALYSSDKNFG